MCRALIVLLLVPVAVTGQGLPLFGNDATLRLTLEVPLSTLLRNAGERPVVQGKAAYIDGQGSKISLPVAVSTRGRSRLEICRFPPLSLTFRKKDAQGTIFEGQKTLKLVTHCQRNKKFRGYVRQEYAIYEAFTVLTDISFRARYLDIEYRDSEKPGSNIDEHGFLIESIDELASRTGLVRQKTPALSTGQLDPGYTMLSAAFQYLVGNTDWSVKQGPEGSNCCHNGRPLSAPDAAVGWKVVPYDFDQTGIINPDYAAPDARFRLRSVRQRLWRGRCVHNDELDAVVGLFNENRARIEAVLVIDGVPDARSTKRYIDTFFQIINDPGRRQTNIEKRCLAD